MYKQVGQGVEQVDTYLQGIVDTVRQPFVVIDAHLRVVLANRSFYKTFQLVAEKCFIYDLNTGQWSIPVLQGLLELILRDDIQIEDFEIEQEFPTIGRKTLILNARKLRHPSNHAEMILLAIEDITQKRQGEQALRETNERFRLLAENAKDYAMLVLDKGGNIVSWTPGAERIIGWQESEVLGENASLIFTPEDRELGAPEQEILKAATEGRAEDKRWHLRKDGSRFFAEGVTISLRDERGNLKGFGKVFLDATERKLTEEALRESDARLRFVLDAGQLGSWDVDLFTELHNANRSLKHDQIFGYDVLLPEWNYEIFLKHVHPEDREFVDRAFQQTLSTHEDWDFECRIIWSDQSVRWIWARGSVYYDPNGKPICLLGVIKDISDRKRTEEKIKASLQEKEVLLKEVHHRVKNNLQIIDSLFRHQLRHTADKQAAEILKECQNRVNSMALIHEKLYQSKNISKIDISGYIRSLAANLFDSYNFNLNINLDIKTIDISLGIELAIPCGLIVNELVSNSLKYAFATDKGEIKINFWTNNTNSFVLVVSDNGVGIPENIDFDKIQTLGLKLVKSLVRQLEATIEINRSAGTEVIITFPIVENDI